MSDYIWPQLGQTPLQIRNVYTVGWGEYTTAAGVKTPPLLSRERDVMLLHKVPGPLFGF